MVSISLYKFEIRSSINGMRKFISVSSAECHDLEKFRSKTLDSEKIDKYFNKYRKIMLSN